MRMDTEELRRLRYKTKKVNLTMDDEETVVECEATSVDAVPGWGRADVPEGLAKESMLTRSLDIALGLLYHERAMTVVDLADLVVRVWKVQANYNYGDFMEAVQCDPRFQVLDGLIVTLADEPDPWGMLLERIEQEQARLVARRKCDD
jgi:hypothetical protein